MKSNSAGLVIFDLDNTLVDRNAVFENAQREIIERTKGCKATERDMRVLREMDSILIEKKKSHLYPFEILALSLWFYYHKNITMEESILKSLSAFEDKSRKSKEIEEAIVRAEETASIFNDIINGPAKPFEGVKEVLETMKKRGYKMILLSESSELMQRKTLEVHNLKHYFDDIILCAQKNKKCFLDIKKQWGGDDSGTVRFFVVGDGIERDIVPGNEAGAVTVWKPGNFNPGVRGPGVKQPDYSVEDIRDLLTILP
ncbi:MAG: HAD family hydrolase [Theionarchaea archaeon]|nr:MAG: hypothetical protein AYK18_06645 [Theionarchaea archaeon DG-70]MBU7011291.1 HAD family hydrolase [Theionarchaea archaeon]